MRPVITGTGSLRGGESGDLSVAELVDGEMVLRRLAIFGEGSYPMERMNK